MFSDIKYLSPSVKLIFTCFLVFVFFLGFMLLSIVIAIPFFGLNTITQMFIGDVSLSAENIAFFKYLQTIQSIGLFIIPSLLLAKIFGDQIANYLFLNKKVVWQSALICIGIVVFSNPLINQLGIWNLKMELPSWLAGLESWMRNAEDEAAVLTKLFLKTDSFYGLLFTIFMIGILPAIGEELLFRGVIQRLFTEWTKNIHWGIWITAILFSAIHFQFYGFVPRAILGAMFGYMFVISRNLWLPILAHFVNNSAAVIAYYLFGEGVLNVDPEKLGTEDNWLIYLILSIVGVAFLFRSLSKFEKKESNCDKFPEAEMLK